MIVFGYMIVELGLRQSQKSVEPIPLVSDSLTYNPHMSRR